ncbi:transporter suffix domain-containing protein [Pelotomaculum sp. FP]|uniref:transporter suffix domain-containing protein n=1 Tax=Pelotomaculum sp. FP TaxID=261474 RepID=UPI001065A046|nr:transporter suffix domain-containing protein [Pelotomaculum sp. FP]
MEKRLSPQISRVQSPPEHPGDWEDVAAYFFYLIYRKVFQKHLLNSFIKAFKKESQILPDQKHQEANKSLLKKIGIALVILSCVLYGGLFIVPFIPCSVATKAIISTSLVISGEASFWIGGIILGKELVSKFRYYFNPMNWFKKKGS